jgi:Helix-turn-helix domain
MARTGWTSRRPWRRGAKLALAWSARAKAAALTETSQPILSNLLRGKFRGFSIERLMLILTAFGRDIEVVVRPAARSKKRGGIKFRREAA